MCDRNNAQFMSGCLSHVLLTFDEHKTAVARVDVTGPYCAGL